jgi:hypothetical protein
MPLVSTDQAFTGRTICFRISASGRQMTKTLIILMMSGAIR